MHLSAKMLGPGVKMHVQRCALELKYLLPATLQEFVFHMCTGTSKLYIIIIIIINGSISSKQPYHLPVPIV
jgi:hypothetical protein